ncbi:sodium-coupled monocarboxylate transporter 1-like isoform X2 [Agrilus planipennis]|uniref:Sodium-coupled monocarboxylate transporter 1-like isoform X2 n=2 Tax=Agrilus planipennis TaxID=224129 RepID=A0A1W4XEU6_AGRPL|nr:sodium-coupled monocarboxylate transporter 1-like isoform X2 [Agrilus planipennis]
MEIAEEIIRNVTEHIGVTEIETALRRFGWADYMVFILMLTVCIGIGIYFGVYNAATSSQEYLVGERAMKTVPIAMSLIASFVSGISLLGIPTEIYVYGIQYVYIFGGVILMGIIMENVFLPVFHNLKVTSTYEYLERRFDKRIRFFGALLFSINLITWLPLVVYVPALAFNQVTGVNIHLVTPIVCLICIFYTSVGGIKAVVWTDVIQTVLMLLAIILVIVKGSLDVGGFGVVWERNWISGRIESPNLDPNPLSRTTLWSLIFGGCIYWLQSSGVNQNMMQRYLSLPSLSATRRALWIFVAGFCLIIFLCSYTGLLLYATYHDCDPLTTTLAKEKDQLLPVLVMEVLGKFPGLPGLFVAGVFSAALSSLSTGLNSMSAVVLEDVYKSFLRKEVTEKQSCIIMRITVIIFGMICVGMVGIVEKLGAVLQATMSIGAIAHGPSLALFSMGVLLPWVTAKGALVGSAFGLIFMSWLCLNAQAALASGNLSFPEKPVDTGGCLYHFTPNQLSGFQLNATNVTHTDETFMLYRVSYLWYTLVGALVSMSVALITSFITRPLDPRDIDPKLLAPFVRRFIPARNYPNQPKSDEVIYAYEFERVR